MKYQRILLKMSGESLAGAQRYGLDSGQLEKYADEIASVYYKKIQVAVVLGGGNIFRGFHGNKTGIDRVQGDYMGMLATVINSMGLQAVLQQKGIPAVVLGAIEITPLCEKMNRQVAIKYLQKEFVVLISGGTGNPFFTTDTAAALRAVEISADVILKATRVDGVYTANPEKDPSAVKFNSLSFSEAYDQGLMIMDLTAFTLCSENRMPVVVFDVNTPGNLLKVVQGDEVGTLIYP